MQSKTLWRCVTRCLVAACFGIATLAQAQESDSELLARRLAALEAEVVRLRSQVAAPTAMSHGDDVSSDDVLEPASHLLPPPSPGPLLDIAWSQAAVTKPEPAPIPKFPTVQVNGFFQADGLYFSQDDLSRIQNGDIQDGAGFRRFRLSAKGAVAENVNYFAQLDFGFFGRPTFTDLWGEVTKVPVLGNVRFGQWKQPYSLEVVTSVRYQTFLERSVLFQPFTPFRHIGLGFYNHSEEEDLTWAMSVFRQGQDQFGNDLGDAGGAASAGRLTWLPYFDNNGDGLSYLHLGTAYYIGDPASDSVRYSTIPEAFVGAFGLAPGSAAGTSGVAINNVANGTPPFVDTGAIPAHMFSNVGTELLWVEGPLSLQSEVQMSTLARRAATQVTFWGYYVTASYFLTGESRPYDRKAGALDRVVPICPFGTQDGCWKGPGAWELAMRYSHINMNDENIRGGRLSDWTVGVNWHLNGYTKVQFNYIHAMQQKFAVLPTSTDIFGIRAQVDW